MYPLRTQWVHITAAAPGASATGEGLTFQSSGNAALVRVVVSDPSAIRLAGGFVRSGPYALGSAFRAGTLGSRGGCRFIARSMNRLSGRTIAA